MSPVERIRHALLDRTGLAWRVRRVGSEFGGLAIAPAKRRLVAGQMSEADRTTLVGLIGGDICITDLDCVVVAHFDADRVVDRIANRAAPALADSAQAWRAWERDMEEAS